MMRRRNHSETSRISNDRLTFGGRLLLVAVMASASSLLGCGDGATATTTVKGAVSVGGKPVTAALINFKPTTGQPLGGALQPDGTFQFDLPPGEYQVRVQSVLPVSGAAVEGADVKPAASAKAEASPQVPGNYANFATSGLTLTVGTESPQQHDVKLP